MTNFEAIKGLDFDGIVDLLVWQRVFSPDLDVPDCEVGCEEWHGGCAVDCPRNRQERAVREWLESEV